MKNLFCLCSILVCSCNSNSTPLDASSQKKIVFCKSKYRDISFEELKDIGKESFFQNQKCDTSYYINCLYEKTCINLFVVDKRHNCFEFYDEDLLTCYINRENKIMLGKDSIEINDFSNRITSFYINNENNNKRIHLDWDNQTSNIFVYEIFNLIKESYESAYLKNGSLPKLKLSTKYTILTTSPPPLTPRHAPNKTDK